GLMVYFHVSDMLELALAFEAGVDHLLHFTGVEIDWARHGDMIQSLVDREVHWVTTLMIDKSFIYPLRPEWIDTARASGLFDRELSLAANFGMSPEAARRNAELVYGEPDPDFATNPILVKQFEDLRRLHALGIDLVVGTDVGNRYILPGYSLHEEMALLEQAGFGPVDVLKMATINAAELVGAAERLGSVEPGKLADLVLLNSDPRETVANLSDIHAVLKAGNKIR
ncbi:MAG: amidohydrolase family protein, partial [Pseudomonadota bacterium]